MIDLERSTSVFTGFTLMSLIAVGFYWTFSPGIHARPRRDAVVTLKQPLVICRSADSVRRKGDLRGRTSDIALPRMIVHECKTAEAGTELTVEEIGRSVARVREKEGLASAFVSTDQIMANVPAVALK